jgi:hypothetical protein
MFVIAYLACLSPCLVGFFIVALAVPVLDLVGGVPACAAAGDFLDEGSGVGGQLGPIVQEAELVVIDRHDDDLAAVGVPDLELGPGDHERALAGDHPGHAAVYLHAVRA